MRWLKTRLTHCPACDEYLGHNYPHVTIGELCQLVVLCPECDHEIALVTTEEVLG